MRHARLGEGRPLYGAVIVTVTVIAIVTAGYCTVLREWQADTNTKSSVSPPARTRLRRASTDTFCSPDWPSSKMRQLGCPWPARSRQIEHSKYIG